MSQSAESPIHVLHVDDEPDLAAMTARFLEREADRFRVEAAHDATEGLDRLAETDFDCIVSDFDMPSMNGLEFLEAIRNDYPDLPFILFTGKGSEEVASEAISAGVSDYLQKGTGTEQYELLANRIENIVTQHRAERRAMAQERTLTLLRDINQALVGASTRDEIETAVTDIFVAAEPYRLTWVGEYDAEWDRLVPRAAGGIDLDAVTPLPLSDRRRSEGSVLDAILTDELTIGQPGDPTLEVWGEDTTGVDYEVAAVVPLSYHGDRHGVITLYADEAGWFDADERAMLEEIGGDMAQALHTAETHQTLQRHRTAVETVPEGVFILDEDATIVLANESAAALADRTPEAIMGESFPLFVEEGIVEPEIIDWYLDSVREMLSSTTDRDEARLETEITRPNDGDRAVEIHLSLRPYEDEYRGTAGIIRDITEQRRRERALEENKERYRRLVENAPVPIVLYDEAGSLVFVNDAAVEFIGAPDQEALLGEPAFEFVHPTDRDRATTRMQRVLEERKPAPPTELTLVDRAGSRKAVVISTVPVTYEKAPAGQAVLKDVTEQNQRAHALERQRDRLDEFASIVSHDLRNPLNVAMGGVNLARGEDDIDQLTRVETALERMNRLIEDLLTFARVGESALDQEPVDFTDWIESTWRTIETGEATLHVETEVEIVCDPSRSQRLFENLIGNAIQHGGSDATITVGTLEDGSGIYFADDGPGVPFAERDRVFESGYTTSEEGTGLGLAIVREIADAHGWTISLTESEDEGARFDITGVDLEPKRA